MKGKKRFRKRRRGGKGEGFHALKREIPRAYHFLKNLGKLEEGLGEDRGKLCLKPLPFCSEGGGANPCRRGRKGGKIVHHDIEQALRCVSRERHYSNKHNSNLLCT